MAKTNAIVLSDGEVVSKSYMDQFATKSGDSKQLSPDAFKEQYGKNGLKEPLYNFEALAQLLEVNPYHYRAVKTKARDVAGLGWKLEPNEHIDNPSEEEKKKALALLERPNADMHLSEINDQVMVDFEAMGNGYHEVMRDKLKDGEVIGLEHIPAHTVRRHSDLKRYVQKRSGVEVWFKAFGFEYDVDAETGKLYDLGSLDESRRANEILHIKNYTSRSDYYGLPDIVPAMGSVLGDKERQEYNISFFENHAVPAYAVTVTGADLDDDTERQIKKFFQQNVKQAQQSTLVVTAQKDEADDSADPIEMNFQALSTDTKEASFRMYRQDNRDEILSANGVPPYRAGITVEGTLGGSSAEESTEIYKQSIIKPRQELMENQINRHILEEGLDIKDWRFRFEEIDTRNIDKEMSRMSKFIKNAMFSPNKALEEMGYEPVKDPNMDKRYLNGKPLDQLASGQAEGGSEPQAMMNAMKDLHRDLLTMAKKG